MSDVNLCPAPELADLPEEMVLEILLRLPIESMMRFKCVCKSWHSLFKSPKFVASHLSNQSKDCILLKRYCPHKARNVMCFLSNADDDVGVSSVVDVELPSPIMYMEEGERQVIVGHCNGIVALFDCNEQIVICNPAIREFRTLPKSSFHPSPRNYYDVFNPRPIDAMTNGIGFGYDSRTKDYKVVRIVAFRELSARAEVFSVSNDSSWREISNTIGAQVCEDGQLEQYFDGVCYWWAIDDDTHKQVILSFDMADEVFRKAPVPDLWADRIPRNLTYLMVSNNESIGFLSHQYRGFDIEMWAMKEFGVKESWTKLLTIRPLQGLEKPLAFWKNDKEILLENAYGQLVTYDLATMESKNLPIHGIMRSWGAIPYMKTLVSVNRPKEDMMP